MLLHDHRYVPKQGKIRQIAHSIAPIIFNHGEYRFDFNAVVSLLNMISRMENIPQPPTATKPIDWGSAIEAVYNMQQRYKQLGTNGTVLQKQNKQAITCGVMKYENGGVSNKSLLRQILPHKDKDCKREYINQCESYLKAFLDDNDDTNYLCKDYNIQRDSYVHILCQIALYLSIPLQSLSLYQYLS